LNEASLAVSEGIMCGGTTTERKMIIYQKEGEKAKSARGILPLDPGRLTWRKKKKELRVSSSAPVEKEVTEERRATARGEDNEFGKRY